MSGELYFVSPDLARFVTSPSLNRADILLEHEDVAMANLVHEISQPVTHAKIFRSHGLFEHGKHVKNATDYQKRWNEWLARPDAGVK